jgi:hypothetical protein
MSRDARASRAGGEVLQSLPRWRGVSHFQGFHGLKQSQADQRRLIPLLREFFK